jgi:hypothetical protein
MLCYSHCLGTFSEQLRLIDLLSHSQNLRFWKEIDSLKSEENFALKLYSGLIFKKLSLLLLLRHDSSMITCQKEPHCIHFVLQRI